MDSKFENYIKRIDVAPNISIGLRIDAQIETYGDCQLMFDLASLTKVFCGTLVIKLSELNYFKLDDSIDQYLEINCSPTIRQLLTHSSGLSDQMLEFNDSNQLVVNCPEKLDTDHTEYADINYIVLYQFISTFGDYQQLLKKYVTTDLEIVYKPTIDEYRFAPTEIRTDRGQVYGQVHDSKAYKMGAVSGHAGLFANLDALVAFFTRLVAGKIINPESFKDDNGERNLLFEVKNHRQQMGDFEGKACFHTGFTGTSVLIDFESKQFIIILTNRISPNRLNQNIFEFRQQVHNHFYQRCQRRTR